MKSITNKDERAQLTSKEKQCFSEIKNDLAITKEIYNDDFIINAIKMASKRNSNADEATITKMAYNHLKRFKSDARSIKIDKNIDYDERREYLL